MAAPLPLPALHATHAGIWLASRDGEVREASRGEAIARTSSETWQIPLEVLDGDPLADDWVAGAVAAVNRLLGA